MLEPESDMKMIQNIEPGEKRKKLLNGMNGQSARSVNDIEKIRYIVNEYSATKKAKISDIIS